MPAWPARFAKGLIATFAVLGLRNYRYFWLSNATADLGVELRIVATAWLTLELTGSPFWVGFIASLPVLPALFLSVFGGILADRMDRRGLIVIDRLVRVALAFTIAFLIGSQLLEVWHLIAIVLTMGFAMSIAGPAQLALIADLVDKRRLLAANSLGAMANNAGEILGSAMAGYLIATAGAGSAFYTIGVLYLVSVLLMLRVRGPATIAQPQPDGGDRGMSTYLRDIAVAIEFVRNSQPLSRLLVMVAIGMFSTAIFPLMPVYARDVLNVGASGYGILGVAIGCGFLAGSLTSTALANVMGRGTTIVVFAIVWDLSMAAFGLSRVFALSVALVFTMGIGGAVFSTLVTTLSQTYTPPQMRGRVASLFGIANSISALGMVVTGAVASVVGNELSLMLGLLITTPVVLFLYLGSHALRRS